MTQIIGLRKTVLVTQAFKMEETQRKIKFQLKLLKGLVKRYKELKEEIGAVDANQIDPFLSLLDDINGTPVEDVVYFRIELEDVKEYVEREMMQLMNLLERNGSPFRERCKTFPWRVLFDLSPEVPKVQTTIIRDFVPEGLTSSLRGAKVTITKEEFDGESIVGDEMGPEDALNENEASGSGGL